MVAEKEYTTREVAQALNLHRDTVIAYCRRGIISGYKKKVHTLKTWKGTKLHFAEGVEVWVVPESELKRLKKERGIK
jgi:hypothetical protein